MLDVAEEFSSSLEVIFGDIEVKLLLFSVCRLVRLFKELVGEVSVIDFVINSIW